MPLQPFQRLGDTEKRTEQQDLIIRRRLRTLPFKGGVDAGIRLHRGTEVRQGRGQFGSRATARGIQRRHRPVVDEALQRRDNALQILVGEQAKHREAAPLERPGRQAPGQVLRRMRVMPDIQQQLHTRALPAHLTAIEVNGTYYSTFKPPTFAKWRDETPDGFVFSLKANRFATNRKVLADAGESVLPVPEPLRPVLASATLALSAATSLYGEIGTVGAASGNAQHSGGLNGAVGVQVRW